MNTLGWLVCKAFVEWKAPQEKDSLLSFFPPPLKEKFSSLESPSKTLCDGFDFPSSLLKHVHYSWFAPLLRALKEQEIPLFLALFPQEIEKNLKDLLLFSGSVPTLCPLTKRFLQERLAKELLQETPHLLPLEALSPEGLGSLLTLSFEELHLLLNFLGLHDLAVETKQIIDTIKLKKITSFLSRDESLFLRNLTQRKEPVLFKKMDLARWDGEGPKLRKWIQKRGMNRLAKALYPAHPSLVWYIKHKMSHDEADLFSSLFQPLKEEGAAEVLAKQVLTLTRFFHKNTQQRGDP